MALYPACPRCGTDCWPIPCYLRSQSVEPTPEEKFNPESNRTVFHHVPLDSTHSFILPPMGKHPDYFNYES